MNIDLLRKICLKLKGVTEDVKWGNDLVFSIGGKMFCAASLEPPFSCSFKVSEEEFEELSIRPGFAPAPYLARAKWVLVNDSSRLHQNEWEQYIRQSYELVKSKLSKKDRDKLN
ncbi:MAG: MmcQ/YjbR family DNA-binding protein [Flavisolibacter sp.]